MGHPGSQAPPSDGVAVSHTQISRPGGPTTLRDRGRAVRARAAPLRPGRKAAGSVARRTPSSNRARPETQPRSTSAFHVKHATRVHAGSGACCWRMERPATRARCEAPNGGARPRGHGARWRSSHVGANALCPRRVPRHGCRLLRIPARPCIPYAERSPPATAASRQARPPNNRTTSAFHVKRLWASAGRWRDDHRQYDRRQEQRRGRTSAEATRARTRETRELRRPSSTLWGGVEVVVRDPGWAGH